MALPSFFVGVWNQPIESFPKWKAEGINLVIKPDVTLNNTPAQRRKACADNGLYYIDQPSDANDTLTLMSDPWCYGLMYPDEPTAVWYSSDPVNFQKAVNAWNALWTPILSPAHGKKPIWCNFAGGALAGARPWNTGEQVIPFAPLADEVCQDTYPIDKFVSQWDQWNSGIGLPVNLSTNSGIDPLAVGTTYSQYAVRLLKQFFPGKPVWSYIETCQFESVTTARQVTPADFAIESASLLKEGLKGIVYFTHNFNGAGWNAAGGPSQSNWDGRTPEMAAACKALTQSLVAAPTDPQIALLQAQVQTLNNQMAGLQFKINQAKAALV